MDRTDLDRPEKGLIIAITGATDGLGHRVALELASQGHTLLVHGRNPAKGRALVSELEAMGGGDGHRYFNADLASLAETRQLAEALRESTPRLDVLVNNAGIGPRQPDSSREISADGHEWFFAVNYLAGYLLTRELLPLLRDSAPARIINVASIGQAAIDFDNVMLENGYDDFRAYRQSKLAQILFTFDLAEELAGSGVTVNCLHPATLMNTKMVFDSGYFPGSRTTIEEGAQALERLAVAAELEGVSGEYFDGLEKSRADDQAYDPGARQQLRFLSEVLVAGVA